MEEIVEKVFEAVESAEIDREAVRFIYLFGSYLEDQENANDVDLAVSLEVDDTETAGYRIRGRVPERYDVSVFENLPLQVKKQVLEGKLIYSRDCSVYDIAYDVLRDFENFKPLYREALGV